METYYKIFPSLKDDKYRFKSWQTEWIVVLELLDDRLTNENRKNVIDKEFASYRANKVKVIMIFNKFSPNQKTTIKSIKNDIFRQATVEYMTESVVESDSFDENLEKVNTHGIHYYKSLLLAYIEQLFPEQKQLLDANGKHKYWYDNGQLLCNGNKYYYIDGRCIDSMNNKPTEPLSDKPIVITNQKAIQSDDKTDTTLRVSQNEPIRNNNIPIQHKQKVKCCCTFNLIRLLTKM